MLSRRRFLQGAAISGAVLSPLTLGSGLALADARTDRRLVVVLLRGGMDGLSALVPYGDPSYRQVRGDLSLESDRLIKLDSRFGLHPSLAPLAPLYEAGDMTAVPATAIGFRTRSHFDAQNVLELGVNDPNARQSGWLNRVVGALSAPNDNFGLAFGRGLPLILRGRADVASWAPSGMPRGSEDYLSLVRQVYAQDPLFSESLMLALNLRESTPDAMEMEGMGRAGKGRTHPAFQTLAEVAGHWLAKEEGPRIATLELGGWDTHVRQGTEEGRLANKLLLFAQGLEALRQALGAAWSQTLVVAMTEFGRTARPNGNRGTDHGTAGTTFLFGGALRGGRVAGPWPGLAPGALFEDRDLMPVIDQVAVLKGLLSDHYGFSRAQLDSDIFPGSGAIERMPGLIRT